MTWKSKQKPLQPLASWADTTYCVDDDDDDFNRSYLASLDEKTFRCEEGRTNQHIVSSSSDEQDLTMEEWWQMEKRGSRSSCVSFICRKTWWRSKRFCVTIGLFLLCLALVWTIIHLSVRTAKSRGDQFDEYLDEFNPTSAPDMNGIDPSFTPTRPSPVYDDYDSEDISDPPTGALWTTSPAHFEFTTSASGSPLPSPTLTEPSLDSETFPPYSLSTAPSSSVQIVDTEPPVVNLDVVADTLAPSLRPSNPPPTMQPTLPPTADIVNLDVVADTLAPSLRPSNPSPTMQPILPPTADPTHRPSPQQEEDNNVEASEAVPPRPLPSPQETVVVLYPNENLAAGQFRSSPNGKFQAGLNDLGNLVLMYTDDTVVDQLIWSSGTSGDGVKVFLQPDGNMIVRSAQRTNLWSSETHGYPGARLILTDQGKLALEVEEEEENSNVISLNTATSSTVSTSIWMDGIPRSFYNGPPSPPEDLVFPVRGAFYYPWYPQTWTVNGKKAHYEAALGLYSSSDPGVAAAHVDAMDYAHIDLSIASWWGPNTNLDKARLTMLMDQTVAMGSRLKWSVYHEDERDFNPTVEEIRMDLAYIKKWFAWHEAWAHKDGKPVIFVYNEAGCDIASRWAQASNGEWYVVLKLFGGFMDCPSQPDSWHQYGCGRSDGTLHNPGHSFVTCPGFWHASKDVPLIPRVSQDVFCKSAQRMVESHEPWQLIVSFNEAGEGTLIENSPSWPSSSGYGQYLDCLARNF